jgi:hypothetical protein
MTRNIAMGEGKKPKKDQTERTIRYKNQSINK